MKTTKGKTLPIAEHWLISLRFKDEKQRSEFHTLLREHKGIFKNWEIEFNGYSGEFNFPLVKITKRRTQR